MEAKGKERRVQEAGTRVLGKEGEERDIQERQGWGARRHWVTKDKGHNTPIESLLDVLGTTETRGGREKETKRESAPFSQSDCSQRKDQPELG